MAGFLRPGRLNNQSPSKAIRPFSWSSHNIFKVTYDKKPSVQYNITENVFIHSFKARLKSGVVNGNLTIPELNAIQANT